MKIRSGFVSNSSSASFVIKTTKYENIINTIFEGLEFAYFSKYRLSDEIKENISRFEKDLKIAKEECAKLILVSKEERKKGRSSDPLEWAEHDVKMSESRLNYEKEALQEIETCERTDIKKLVEFGFKYNRVFFKELNTGYEFKSWVSMFNDYSDMPQILKELIVVFQFKGIPIDCSVEDD